YIRLYVDKDRKGLIGFSGDDDLIQLVANAVTINGTLTVGVDDTGHDVRFWGATTGHSLLWDESADRLDLFGDASGGNMLRVGQDGAGNPKCIIQDDGVLRFASGGYYGIVTNEYAFKAGDAGLFFSAVNYEFRDADGNPSFTIGITTGDIETLGTVGNAKFKGNIEQVAATGTNLFNAESRFGDSSNFSKFETDGTLEFNGTATVFEDIVISLDSAKVPAANAPTWSGFIGNLNAYTYGVNDFQEFTSEISHSYKEASTILFHLHGATNGQEGSDKTIKFEIEYELVDNQTSGAFGDVYTGTTPINAEITIPSGTTDKTSWVIDVGTDATGNFLQGASIKGRIRRIASSGAEPASDPFVIQVGIHVEQDTIGSRTELTK
ncbi:hypothetical protein LCGC14_0376430, partial [marine sediment metagenome]